jgi:hypothetical protein
MGVYGGVTNSWINISPSNSLSGIVTSGLVLALDAGRTLSLLNSVDVLVVGGGGGGGTGSYAGGGGGGGGGFREATAFPITPGSAITVTVGSGGSINSNGGSSLFSTITSTGGGAGGGFNGASLIGLNGGSGGGGGAPAGTGISLGGTGNTPPTSPPQGNSGGVGEHISGIHAAFGGGGGAGGIGGDFVLTPGSGIRRSDGGFGGAGSSSSISGTSVTYAGGGGGGGHTNQGGIGGIGGVGGGGSGSGPGNAVAGTPNTGGGGGGQGHSSGAAATGGSGIVIVRYPGAQRATGGTVTSSGGYTIHTFTTVGSTTFTPLTWADLSGNSNTGTLTNGPTYSSANFGSIVFDGVDDYSTSTSVTNSLTTLQKEGSLTYEYWIKPTASIKLGYTESNGGASFYSPGSATPQGLSGDLSYNYGDGGSIYVGFGFAFGTNGFVAGVHKNSYAPPILVDYQTYNGISHLVVIKNATNCSYYINGVLKKTSLTVAGGATIIGDTMSFIANSAGQFMNIFKGDIYSVKFYNRALSATEILQNYNATRRRFGI